VAWGLLFIWVEYACFASLASAPIFYLGRHRTRWNSVDFLALVLPFGVWLGLLLALGGVGKSLANLCEPFVFCAAVPVAALIRVMAGGRVPDRVCSMAMVVLLCIFAALVYLWTPIWPE
jgi:hypothetical protein